MRNVRVEALSKRYGDTVAVKDISFAAEEGEFVTLLGPSGCGKTTTLRMIAGFVSPSAGRIEIGGVDVTGLAPNRRNVGLVFQSYALFPHMSVADNVAFGLRMRGVARREREARVIEALAMVQLAGFERRLPRQLSGGQQQRVALARALVISPQLLLLDEPFGALDKQLRDHMRDELLALQRRLGVATLFVTHDQQEALSMSDRVVVMNCGVVEQIGPPDEIYERPRNRFVAEFLGRSNLLTMQVRCADHGGLELASGTLKVPLPITEQTSPGRSVLAMIWPELIALRPDDTGGQWNAGCVIAATYLGAMIQIRVMLDDGTPLEVLASRRGLDGVDLASGTRLGVDIFPDGVWTLDSEGG